MSFTGKLNAGMSSFARSMKNGAVEGFGKITDKFVDQFLTREGESVEDAKKRLQKEQEAQTGVSDIVSEASDSEEN